MKGQKYLDKTMIFFYFLYYLDIKFKDSKDNLIKRNLLNNDLNFLKDEFNLDKIISFNYKYFSSNEKKEDIENISKSELFYDKEKKENNDKLHRRENKRNKKFESINEFKHFSLTNNKNTIILYFTSEQLLNLYIQNLFETKLNNLKKEYFSLKLIMPSYLNDEQKNRIKNIF